MLKIIVSLTNTNSFFFLLTKSSQRLTDYKVDICCFSAKLNNSRNGRDKKYLCVIQHLLNKKCLIYIGCSFKTYMTLRDGTFEFFYGWLSNIFTKYYQGSMVPW